VKIYAGSDHAGVKLKGALAQYLRGKGHAVVDLGTDNEAASDYPDWAARVAHAVRDEQQARGLLVCGSGIGVSIVANKVQGVRAVDAWTADVARVSRSHNDTNVLCLGERLVSEADARAIADAWLATAFEGGRHVRRLEKIAGVEASEAAAAACRSEAALLGRRHVLEGVWGREPAAFVPDAATNEPARKSILSRLGWLRAPEEMERHLPDVLAFAAELRAEGFKQAVLLGMGGSSLCPEVLARTFGVAQEGLGLLVLDSTDPASVRAIEAAIDLPRTLFIVASKSGGTIEVASFENHFWRKALELGGLARARAQFCAITDPNTELYFRARDRYRKTFVNPADIGGRYSALSLFGLVPAALLGMDVRALLARGREMAEACRQPDPLANPGAALGAFMGGLAKQGKDKLTLVASPEIASAGAWIEQLVAESTGKQGRGVLPVDLEPLGAPQAYGDDRAFVLVHLEGGRPAAAEADIQALRAAGHPLLELRLPDRYALGAEFFRWELATAVAGASLQVNPFDEPNVTEAKEATSRALKAFWDKGRLPDAGETLSLDDPAAIAAHLGRAGAGDYIAVCAFFHRTDQRERLLTQLRVACRDRWRVATTLGFGPRFLHSTGQLHKGGPNTGVFLQLTAGIADDLPVPEKGFSFGTLRDAQALGDLEALRHHQRRAARVHLGGSVEAGLERLLEAVAKR
jgi:RpiB/LacA/LacB family sugar-phosphate isomerase